MNSSTSAQADRTSMSCSLRDRRNLSYSIYGPDEGIPFVMFHGSPGSRISMEDDLLHRIGVKMIYPERPGYGNSSPHPNATFLSWADDIREFLDYLEVENVAIGGASGGGPFAMACAAAFPERLSSLTLISSAAPQNLPGYKNKMAFGNRLGYFLNKYAPFLMKYATASFAKRMLKNPEKTFDQIFKQLGEADRKVIRSMKEEGTFRVILDHLREAYSNGVKGHIMDNQILTEDWNILYDKITCPVHIWHGEEDTLAPIPGVRALAAFLPHATPNYIAGAGHLLMENQEVFGQILDTVREAYINPGK